MRSRRIAVGAALVMTAAVGLPFTRLGASTVYVDCGLGDYAGHDGSTPALAYRTIQEGVDAVEAGGTVHVAAGVYSNGVTTATSNFAACRVYITKNLTLKGAGRDVTHIVGAFSGNANRLGSGAVGGIVISSSANAARIEGFTIRDCGDSKKSNAANGAGTAVCSLKMNTTLTMTDRPWIVDCAVSNIHASVGAMSYVNIARTIFQNCVGYDFASVADRSDLVHCLVVHQRQDSNRHSFRGQRSEGATGNRIVNCTILDATSGVNTMSSSGTYYLQNSILDYGGIFSREVDHCVLSNGRGGLGSAGSPVLASCTNEQATCVFSAADKVVASTQLNDFRPIRAVELVVGSATNAIPDSPAIGLADARHLEVFPEEFRWRDVYGNPVVTNANGRFNAGAVQTTMTPVAAFKVNGSANLLKLNGERSCTTAGRTHFVDVWPTLVRIETPTDADYADWGAGKPFFGIWLANDGTGEDRNVFPDSNGRLPFVPAYGRLITIDPRLATDVKYVDAAAENGNADTGSGTQAAPYARIQKAVNSITVDQDKRAVIYVAPGTYDQGSSRSSLPNPKVRVNLNKNRTYFRLVGTGGAERTIIAGAADTSEGAVGGCLSTNAIRCVQTGGNTCVLQGFTLTGGHTARGGEPGIDSGNSYGRGGALWANNAKTAWLIECIVTNNASYYGGAAFANGNAVKCYFADNTVVGGSGAVFDVQNTGGHWMLSSCVVKEGMSNSAADAKVFIQSSQVNGYAVNCTVLGDPETTVFFSPNPYSFFPNTILAHGRSVTVSGGYRRTQGTYVWDFDYRGGSGNSEGGTYRTVDPQFVDEANGDYHLLRSSPAYGGGDAWTKMSAPGTSWTKEQAFSSYYRFLACDMDGAWPTFVGGNPSAGAYQTSTKTRVEPSCNRPGTVSISTTPEGPVFDVDEPVTVTATSETRRVLDIRVNGVSHPNADSVTFTQADFGDASCRVEVVVNTNLYVDAVGGNDANLGDSEATALKTLTAALGRSCAGDVVTALPGTYDEGSSVHTNVVYYYGKMTDTIRLPSRAVIPEGVVLESRDGAEATIIKGAFGANAATGTGEDAIRCVLLGKNAVLRGFTVTGGGTLEGDTTYQMEFFDNISGGGILCADPPAAIARPGNQPTASGYAENCIVSNNATCGGAAANFGSYIHCLFVKNRNGAVREPQYLYGCVVGDNCTGTAGQSIYQPYYVDGCTFLGTDYKSDGSAAAAMYSYPNTALWIVRNTLFLGSKSSTVKFAFNCRGTFEGFLHNNNNLNVWEDVVADPALAVDGAYGPVRTCAAVDAWRDGRTATSNLFHYATPALYLRGTDFAGGQRVYNGAMDVGAGECDWRGRYATVLGGGSRFAVTAATTNVTEVATGVQLTDGQALTSTFRSLSASGGVSEWQIARTGAGTLTVSVNGGAPEVVDADVYRPQLAAGENVFAFAYAGDGVAVLRRFAHHDGTVLTFR